MNARHCTGYAATLLAGLLIAGCPDPNFDGDPNNGEPNTNGNGSTSRPDPVLYGDGSAGTWTAPGSLRLGDAGERDLNFENFIVPADVTLTIQSGTVIRCTGDFVVNGAIVVQTGADGGDRKGFDATTLSGSARTASAGLSTRAAGSGEVGPPGAERSAGEGGTGLSEFESVNTFVIGTLGGGGGGAALASGGAGGGAFAVIAAGAIEVRGEITLDGASAESGGGGGAGGLLVLASRSRVEVAAGAAILARGGAGGPATENSGPGGGGSGGIIHLIAPEIAADGDFSAAGGPPGAEAEVGSIVAEIRSGGGGGGALGGNGGSGGDVDASDAASATQAAAGSDGFILQSRRLPTARL